jgi:hypothetical protein
MKDFHYPNYTTIDAGLQENPAAAPTPMSSAFSQAPSEQNDSFSNDRLQLHDSVPGRAIISPA